MNNNIEEVYCSFECAKLLKEKGFDVKCRYWFDVDGTLWNYNANTWNSNDGNITNFLCTKPTHAVAIAWIQANFDIFIEVSSYYNPFKLDKQLFEVGISRIENGYEGLIQNVSDRLSVDWTIEPEKYWLFNSPQEAVEAALIYVLKNLI